MGLGAAAADWAGGRGTLSCIRCVNYWALGESRSGCAAHCEFVGLGADVVAPLPSPREYALVPGINCSMGADFDRENTSKHFGAMWNYHDERDDNPREPLNYNITECEAECGKKGYCSCAVHWGGKCALRNKCDRSTCISSDTTSVLFKMGRYRFPFRGSVVGFGTENLTDVTTHGMEAGPAFVTGPPPARAPALALNQQGCPENEPENPQCQWLNLGNFTLGGSSLSICTWLKLETRARPRWWRVGSPMCAPPRQRVAQPCTEGCGFRQSWCLPA